MPPVPALLPGLSQRPSLVSATIVQRPYCGRVFAPNARAQGPARGVFGGGQLASDDDDAKRDRCLRTICASAAASSSAFFPSPMGNSEVRMREESTARPEMGKRKLAEMLRRRAEAGPFDGRRCLLSPYQNSQPLPFSSLSSFPYTSQQQQKAASSPARGDRPLASVVAAAIQVGLVSLFKARIFPFFSCRGGATQPSVAFRG